MNYLYARLADYFNFFCKLYHLTFISFNYNIVRSVKIAFYLDNITTTGQLFQSVLLFIAFNPMNLKKTMILGNQLLDQGKHNTNLFISGTREALLQTLIFLYLELQF